MLRIEIDCPPDQIDAHLKALGFMRRPFTGAEGPRMTIAATIPSVRYFYHPESDSLFTTNDDTRPIGDGLVEELSKEQFEEMAKRQSSAANAQTAEAVHANGGVAPNVLADELSALERPSDLKAPEAPTGATRVRGQPAPGRKRRTKEEVADDLAYLQTPEGAKAAADAPASISTGGPRTNPEDEAQDAADEAAESAQRADGPPTMDDLRAAVKRYSDKFGPEVAIVNVRRILGRSMLETLPDEIGNAIAKMDLATSGSTVMGVPTQPSATSLFDDAPAAAIPATPRLAKREDILVAMSAYCVKFDGTSDPNLAPNAQADLPRIMETACGARRISLLPQTPEGFGAAVVAIEEATKNNPFCRPVRT